MTKAAAGHPNGSSKFSRRTQQKDQQAKRALYQRNGVSMYWIVSPQNRTVLYLTLKDGCYSDLAVPVPATGRVDVPQYPGLVIDWDQAFNRLLGRTE